MKKFFMIAAMGLMAFTANAQNAMDDKGKTTGQPSDGIAQVQLANQLAQYGYDNSSASALIEAAAILVEVGGQDLQAEYSQTFRRGRQDPLSHGRQSETQRHEPWRRGWAEAQQHLCAGQQHRRIHHPLPWRRTR